MDVESVVLKNVWNSDVAVLARMLAAALAAISPALVTAAWAIWLSELSHSLKTARCLSVLAVVRLVRVSGRRRLLRCILKLVY